jgi:hypothetical protein
MKSALFLGVARKMIAYEAETDLWPSVSLTQIELPT